MLRRFYETNDLPFDHDAASRYVPWIIGLMIFLSILSLAGSNMVSQQLSHWEGAFSKGFTVEMPLKYQGGEVIDSRDSQEKMLLKVLQGMSGVEEARLISKSVLSPFLDPFADYQADVVVVDVTLRPGFEVNLSQARSELKTFDNLTLRDHKEWRETTLNFAYSAIFTGILIACLIGIAAVATIIFVTRTGLQVHHKTIEVMHLVGAQHQFIAQQFQRYAYNLARRGGVIGLALLGMSLFLIGLFMGYGTVLTYISETINLSLLLILVLTPLSALLLTILSAHVTVLSTLRQSNTW